MELPSYQCCFSCCHFDPLVDIETCEPVVNKGHTVGVCTNEECVWYDMVRMDWEGSMCLDYEELIYEDQEKEDEDK